jgi:2-phospho-L-lactate guanylyltransferase
MRVVVPFDAVDPKTRLRPLLDTAERHAFARCMLGDVLDAICDAVTEATVDVLTTAPVDTGLEHGREVGVVVDDRPLSPAVNDIVTETVGTEALIVVMADLALVTPEAVTRLVETAGDVVLAPGRGVGTNALVVRAPDFRVDFHGTSFLDHRRAASAVGTVGTVDSFRLSTDIDEADDLVEAFVHGGGRTTEWLRARFELVVDDEGGRVSLDRRCGDTGRET